MTLSPPENRRRKPSGIASPKGIEAPPDPQGGEDSPVPGLATTTVRLKVAGGRRRMVIGRAARALQVAAGVTLVLAASIAVAWSGRRYLTTSPRFAIRTVLVDGTHRRTAKDVAAQGGLVVGNNIFALDLAQVGGLITQDPWIEKAEVIRKLPSTVVANVTEREAAALVPISGALYLSTRDGDLFKKVGEGDPSDLPVVTGILPAQVVNDRPGVLLAIKRALDVAEDAERAGIAKRYPVEEVHIEKDGSLVLTIGREAISLHLGQPPYRDKVEQAARILNEVARRKANASVVFLDNDAHPERVVVRMR